MEETVAFVLIRFLLSAQCSGPGHCPGWGRRGGRVSVQCQRWATRLPSPSSLELTAPTHPCSLTQPWDTRACMHFLFTYIHVHFWCSDPHPHPL